MGFFIKSAVKQTCPTCDCECEETSWNAAHSICIIDALIFGAITYLVHKNTVKCPRCGGKYTRHENTTDIKQSTKGSEAHQ